MQNIYKNNNKKKEWLTENQNGAKIFLRMKSIKMYQLSSIYYTKNYFKTHIFSSFYLFIFLIIYTIWPDISNKKNIILPSQKLFSTIFL